MNVEHSLFCHLLTKFKQIYYKKLMFISMDIYTDMASFAKEM